MSKIFHIELSKKAVDFVPLDFKKHAYFSNLSGLYRKYGAAIGVGKTALDTHDWSKPFENEYCVIRKDKLEKAIRGRV